MVVRLLRARVDWPTGLTELEARCLALPFLPCVHSQTYIAPPPNHRTLCPVLLCENLPSNVTGGEGVVVGRNARAGERGPARTAAVSRRDGGIEGCKIIVIINDNNSTSRSENQQSAVPASTVGVGHNKEGLPHPRRRPGRARG